MSEHKNVNPLSLTSQWPNASNLSHETSLDSFEIHASLRQLLQHVVVDIFSRFLQGISTLQVRYVMARSSYDVDIAGS